MEQGHYRPLWMLLLLFFLSFLFLSPHGCAGIRIRGAPKNFPPTAQRMEQRFIFLLYTAAAGADGLVEDLLESGLREGRALEVLLPA